MDEEHDKSYIPDMMKLMCRKYERKIERMKHMENTFSEELFLIDSMKVDKKILPKGEEMSE